MKKVLLCSNPGKDRELRVTRNLYEMLETMNVTPVICPVGKSEPAFRTERMCFGDVRDEMKDAEMALTLGGDGTLLQAARIAARFKVPLLGINLGKKGFMTELDPSQTELVKNAINGEYRLEQRMMLDITVEREGKSVFRDYALNDAVVGGLARAIQLTVFGDGHKITSFDGDGVIFSTPTGSTAYSLSAGGPIVEPSAENIIVTPICAHLLSARSFVLAPDKYVEAELGRLGSKTAYLSCDGGAPFSLQTGDRISAKRSQYTTGLVRITDTFFYDKLSQKLGERA